MTKLAVDIRRAERRAVRIGKIVKACWCFSRGLVKINSTRCPAHGNLISHAQCQRPPKKKTVDADEG